MRDRNRGVIRPLSLRGAGRGTAAAMGLSAALIAGGAQAQDANGEDEVVLDTLQIEDATADVNPNAQPGVPYKARTSGDLRRVKPLSETPQTIQVLTEQQLEEQGATDLREVLDNVPGVTIGTGENGNAFGDRYIIRGHEARSDVFVDGLRDPGMTTRETFAVDQIEITKGPSSSFAGRGSTGGAVNSITKKASTDYQFTRVDAGIGTDDYYRVTLDANVPLTDTLALRANLLYGYEEVPNRNFSDRERYGAAVSAAFKPSEVFELVLDYYHLTANDTPDLGGYVPRPTGTGPDDVTVYEPWDDVPNYTQNGDFLDSDVDTVTGRIYITPFDGFTIVNSTRYGETSNGYVLTGLRGGAYDPATDTYAPVTLSTHQGNQEVEYFVNQFNVLGEFATGTVLHNLIVGAEYSNLQVANGTYDLTANGATNCVTAGRGGLSPNYCITDENRNVIFGENEIHNIVQRTIADGSVDSDWQVETLSVYAMDTVDFTDWLSIHGGIRMDAFSYSNVVTSRGTVTPYTYSDTLWNGHAGIGVKPLEEVYVYFNYGTAKNINGGESDLGGNCGYGGICVDDGTGKQRELRTRRQGRPVRRSRPPDCRGVPDHQGRRVRICRRRLQRRWLAQHRREPCTRSRIRAGRQHHPAAARAGGADRDGFGNHRLERPRQDRPPAEQFRQHAVQRPAALPGHRCDRLRRHRDLQERTVHRPAGRCGELRQQSGHLHLPRTGLLDLRRLRERRFQPEFRCPRERDQHR